MVVVTRDQRRDGELDGRVQGGDYHFNETFGADAPRDVG